MTDRDAMTLALAAQVELELDHAHPPRRGGDRARRHPVRARRSPRSSSSRTTRSSDSARTLKVSTRRGSRPGGCARTSGRSGRSSTETWAESLRAELRWLGRLLGPVRDAEVLGARLRRRVAAMVGLRSASAKVLLDGLESDRLAGRRRLLEGMRSRRYQDLVVRLVARARDRGSRARGWIDLPRPPGR